jgi:hypothetical protein
MSHTPGPWSPYFYTRNQRLKLGDWRFLRDDGHQPVPLNSTRREVPESAANARLIACAPEMLDALRLAADALDLAQAQVDSENDRDNLCKRLVAVKRVIAKAEGRE